MNNVSVSNIIKKQFGLSIYNYTVKQRKQIYQNIYRQIHNNIQPPIKKTVRSGEVESIILSIG